MSEIRNLRKYLTNFKMKSLRTIFLVAVLGLVACEKDPVEEPPVVTPEKTPTEIACDAYNHPDTTAYYHKDGDWCEKIFTGQPPVEKKDTVLLFNIPTSAAIANGAKFPTSFQLKEIKKSKDNVYLELDQMNQGKANPNAVKGCGDSLRIWIKDGLITVKLKCESSGDQTKDTIILDRLPVQEAIDNWYEIGYVLTLANKSTGSNAKSTTVERNRQDVEKTRTMKRLER